MNNKAVVGIAIALGAVIGVVMGMATPHHTGSWVGIGVAIGAVAGLAITRGRK